MPPPTEEEKQYRREERARMNAAFARLHRAFKSAAASVRPPHQARLTATITTPLVEELLRNVLHDIINQRAKTTENTLFIPRVVEVVCLLFALTSKHESMLIEDIPADAYVIGDLHGNLYDLMRIFQDTSKDGKPGWESGRFVFLGNYVDRGTHNLEVVLVLFILKILHPDRFFLLRGSHESVTVNGTGGFMEEMVKRYGKDTGARLYFTVNWAFCYLSLVGIIGGEILVCHGGISAENFTRSSLRLLPKPCLGAEFDNTVNDIVGGDPGAAIATFAVNRARANSSHLFSANALLMAFADMGVTRLVRGHQIMPRGFRSYWNGTLWTVYSASGQSGFMNHSAYLLIDAARKFHVTVLEFDGKCDVLPDKKRKGEREERREEKEEEEGGKQEQVTIGDEDAGGGNLTVVADEDA